jgi:hypothetical protein
MSPGQTLSPKQERGRFERVQPFDSTKRNTKCAMYLRSRIFFLISDVGCAISDLKWSKS